MAASLSRPDPTSPASVAEAGFSTSRRGYQHDEVRAFLTSVAAEMSRLKERERQLEAELRAARAASTGRVELDEETATKLLGEETLRVLQTARESASQIKVRSEENAARTMRDAHDEAGRIRQEAEVEAARRRHDAQSDAEAEVALAKQQGRDMVNEARAYRERVLADLERRTQLARKHIEELSHGRERLLQVFERARLVAVDVTSGLQAFEAPDEFVNFAPTTGPVPLMVPAGRSPQPAPQDPTAALPIELDDAHSADELHVDELHVDMDTGADRLDGVAAAETGDTATDDVENDDTATDEIAADDIAADEIAVDEIAVDDADAEDVETAAPVAPATPSTNVVSLFRDRVADVVELDDTDLAGGETTAEHEPPRPDVDGLFARLRSEVPADAAAFDAPADESDPDADSSDADSSDAEQQPASAFSRRDEALVPLIVTAARKLKRALADEQNGVLDGLRRKEPVTTLDAIAPDAAAHLAVYAAAIAAELTSAATAGAAELGVKDTAAQRRTLAKAGALELSSGHLETALVAPLRARLERAVVDGHGDNEEITKRVRSVYREWKTHHIDDQLDDLFRFAFGGGVAVSIEPGTPVTWLIDPTESACADCEDNSLAGAIAAGESFPTGHSSAPAHPGCRCLTLPAG